MNKNIVLFIRSMHIGGAEKQSILLAIELSKHYDVFLVIMYKEGQLQKETKGFNNIFYLEGNILNKTLQLFFFLKKKKINYLFNFLPINNIIGSIIGKLVGVDYIYNGIRGSKIKSNVFKMKLQLYLSNYISHKIISNSYKGKQTYSNYGYKKDKIVVIHNMVTDLLPLSSIRNDLKTKQSNKIKILTVGRFVSEKDYPTMFRSISELVSLTENLENIDWELVVVGYGVLEHELRVLVKKHNLTSKVKFLHGKSININECYKMADIYLSTSIFEGMSNTIMEAMSMGLPVVSTNAGDSSYLVKNNFNGFICPIYDCKKISLNLFKLIKNQKLRRQFGGNSYRVIQKYFLKDIIISKYNDLIEND